MNRFRDRMEAGERLGAELRVFALRDPIVLALPRGGVPVGRAIASRLGAPLDVWIVRKVGAPNQPELGLGAVAEGGYVELNHDIISIVAPSRPELQRAVESERRAVEARVETLRCGAPPPRLSGRSVILVDDGIATGGTVRAAIRSVRAREPERLIVAVPVAPVQVIASLEQLADDVVCLSRPFDMRAIGSWYEDFTQVSDDEVRAALEAARTP